MYSMGLIRQDFVSSNKYSIKCPYEMNPIGVCVHNTYNDATAKNEASYMKNNNNQVSYHVVVDDVEAIQVVPFNRNAWAAGDGSSGTGNRKYIHVEICYSKSGGNRFVNAEKRAARVVAEICKQFGWGINNVKAHRDFAKKDCPHRTNMSEFKKMVDNELKNGITANVPKKYTNCVLYGNDIDKVAAEIIFWNKKDCVMKNINDHIKWEGTNLFIVGGVAEAEMLKLNNGEKYAVIKGSDRYETVKEALRFVDKL